MGGPSTAGEEVCPLLLHCVSIASLLGPGSPGPTGTPSPRYHQLLTVFQVSDSIRFSDKHGSANGMELGAKEALQAIQFSLTAVSPLPPP